MGRGLFLVLCALMALYGIASFSSRALTAANGRSFDRTSWTNQRDYDAAAIDFARQAYVREGRDALFVVTSPQIPVTLLTNARILNFEGGRQRRVQASDTRVVSAAMSSCFCRTVSLTRPRAMQCCQRLQTMLPMPGKGRHSGKWTCSFNRVILLHVRVFKHLHSVQQGDQCHAGRRN
jgi:hypothetical protein